MKANIGTVDRIVRVVLGLGIAGLGIYYRNWLGLVAILPLGTALVRVCPAYLPFGLSTVGRKSK